MTVRFGAFNVENLFARPRAFNQETWQQGVPVLQAFAEVSALMEQVLYSPQDKARMIELLVELDIYRVTAAGPVRRNRTPFPRWAWLRANRGMFDIERQDTGVEIVANGRLDWTGWVELATEPVDELNTRMTAQVIHDLGADVLGVIEAEDRPSLDRFNQDLLNDQYGHVMLIDGNDTRGIDVGIMTTEKIDIVSMRSNVDVADPAANDFPLFSRDCAQYLLRLPGNATVWILLNHFKSQSGGGGGAKRTRQAQGVRNIVDLLAAAGENRVIVMGDLNEGPSSGDGQADSLAPLYGAASPLIDAYSLPVFDTGPRPGTFQSCGIRNRLDYIFVTRALADRVTAGGIERRGLWGGASNVNPPQHWEIYPPISGPEHAASDHAAIFVDIDI